MSAYEYTKKEALALMTRPGQYHKWCYENGVAVRGLWLAAEKTGDDTIKDRVVNFTNTWVMKNGLIPTYPAETYNLDMLCYGFSLFDLYDYTKDERYLTAAKTLLKQVEGQPTTPEGGFWHKQIYPNQMWLDGIYMGCPFIARCAERFEKPELFDLVVKQMTLCYEKTFDAETGLCRHAWDSSREQHWSDPETGRSPHVWGRAMGWFIVAHAEVLAILPKDHPGRKAIEDQMRVLADGLMKWQRNGLWYQVITMPEGEGNYTESSCSAMFAYGLYKGAEEGVLSAEVKKCAEKALDELLKQKVGTGVDELPVLHDVCRVAGLGGAPYGDAKYRDGSYNYYIHEVICDDDYKGTAPFLMALAAQGK